MSRILIVLIIFCSFLCESVIAQTAYPVRPSITKTPFKQWYSQSSPEIPPPKPPLIAQKGIIMLDPGHGGHDVGTQSISKPRYQEKSLNLVTANFVKDYLQQLGFKVLLTRKEDKFVSLDARAQMANEMEPDLFISIHYNSAPSAEAQGIEVFYYLSKEDKKRVAQSKRLAQVVLKQTLAHTKANSRGVKHGNFAVIRETEMPAILIEGGFVTNEQELKNLKDPIYLKKIAWGVAKGVEEYWKK